MKSRASPPSLRARALQALAQREYSRAELRAKLLRAPRFRATGGDARRPCKEDTLAAEESPEHDATAQAAVDALLDELQAQGLLDDTRFIESRVHVRAPRFGTQRIRQELQRHGVALDAETAAALSRTELQRAQAVWARRFGQAAAGAAEQAKQMRFLGARGFSAEVVRQVVRQAMRDASAVGQAYGQSMGQAHGHARGQSHPSPIDADPEDPPHQGLVRPDHKPI